MGAPQPSFSNPPPLPTASPHPFAPFPCVLVVLTSGKALLVRVQARNHKGVIEEVV